MTRIWFKRKQYGWGWYPSTWQGWLAIAGFVALEVLLAISMRRATGGIPEFLLYFVPTILVVGFLFVLIFWRKGEKPRWQWGGKQT